MTESNTVTVAAVGERMVTISRTFEAPRPLVFDAFTKPELIKQWLHGPPGWVMTVCEVDLRVGGRYRYVWQGPDGGAMGMGGVHREITAPERLVATQRFDQDWTGGEAISTMVFTERDGRTTLTNSMLYSSREARDAVLETPMAEGMEAGYRLLDELVRELRTHARAAKQKITPFLWFDGRAEEAMNFYTSVFADSKVVSIRKFASGGPKHPGQVVSGTFQIAGQTFFALDGGPMYRFTPAISLFVDCETQEEVDYLWGRLTTGGEEQPCGWLKDQFGLSWQIIPAALGRLLGDPDPGRAKRAMEAMLKMKKIVIRDLEAAAAGERPAGD